MSAFQEPYENVRFERVLSCRSFRFVVSNAEMFAVAFEKLTRKLLKQIQVANVSEHKHIGYKGSCLDEHFKYTEQPKVF